MIITFEGLDGVGKTTIANQLYDSLVAYIQSRNAPYTVTRIKEPMPDGATTQERIDSANAFRKDWQQFIRPNTIYIVDRSLDSTFAYQVAKDIEWTGTPIDQTIVRKAYDTHFGNITHPNRTYWIRANNSDRARWMKERGVDDADVYYEPYIDQIGYAYGQVYKTFDRIVKVNNIDGDNVSIDIMMDLLEVLFKSGDFNELFDETEEIDPHLKGWINETWSIFSGKEVK